MDVEPRPTRTRAGQVITRTRQQSTDVAIDSFQEDDYSGLPDLETDDDEQGSENIVPRFEIQDDGMIEFMHNIYVMFFPDGIIRTNKQTGQIVTFTQHCAWSNRANRNTIGIVGCIRQWRFRGF